MDGVRTSRRGRWRSGVLALGLGASGAWAGALNVTVLDARGQPVGEAVVSLEAQSTRGTTSAAKAEISQKNRSFQPQVTVVQTGTAVSFPNFDTVRHHVYSFSPIKTFEIKLYAGVPSVPLVFDKPGTAVLGCNIHDRMAAYVHVVNTPHFSKTLPTGQAALANLPSGDHLLRVWHPSLGPQAEPLEQAVKVSAALGSVTVQLPNLP